MSLDKIKKDFKEVCQLVDEQLGRGYAVKNPEMVMHLMDKIHQHENQELDKALHNSRITNTPVA
jgi:hypothetical protein